MDDEFDRLVPAGVRHLSALHWTPARAALRAAELLCPTATCRVLDIGAGIGKLCTLGALARGGHWTGIEHHAVLVEGARQVAEALGVGARTRFLHADVLAIEWTGYDALYLYNPFEAAVGGAPSHVPIAEVQRRLAALAPGTRVVTLHGFGGAMPASFELLSHERLAGVGLDLTLWRQRAQLTTP